MIADVILFRQKLIAAGMDYKSLAYKLGMCPVTLSAKINKDTDIKLSEAVDMGKALNLTHAEFASIFFGVTLGAKE